MATAKRSTAGEIAREWWARIAEGESAHESRHRAARARIKRAGNALDLLMEPEVIELRLALSRQPERVAIMAGVIMHVNEHTTQRIARLVGRASVKDADSASMSELRFKRLIHCKEANLLGVMRNAVKAAKHHANVADLAESILRWSDARAGDRIKQQWICDYYEGPRTQGPGTAKT